MMATTILQSLDDETNKDDDKHGDDDNIHDSIYEGDNANK